MSEPMFPPSPFWAPASWTRDPGAVDVTALGAQNIQALIRGWRRMENVLRGMLKHGTAPSHRSEFLADLRVAQEQIRALVKSKAVADPTIPVFAPYRLLDHFTVGDTVMYHPLISTALSHGIMGRCRRSGWMRLTVKRYTLGLVIDSWMMLGNTEANSHPVFAHVMTPHCLSEQEQLYLLEHPAYAETWIEATSGVPSQTRRTFLESLQIERLNRRIRIR